MSRLLQRLSLWSILFILPGALSAGSIFYFLMQRPGADPNQAVDFITQPNLLISYGASGLFWIVIAECVRIAKLPRSWMTALGVGAIGVFGGIVVVRAITLVLMSVFLGSRAMDNPANWDIAAWFELLARPENAISAGIRSILVAVVVVRPRRRSKLSAKAYVPEEFVMSQQPGQVTRLLCANAFLEGPLFRRLVLRFYAQPGIAAAPEIGFDVEKVMQACLFAQRRENSYYWAFLGLAVAVIILATISPVVGALALVAPMLVFYRKTWREQRVLTRFLQRDKADLQAAAAQFTVPLPEKLRDAMPQQGQNLTVYRGYWPFVGMGAQLGSWSFATLVDKPKIPDAKATLPFTIEELYARLDHALSALRLENVEHRDHYFITGTDVRTTDRQLLPSPTARPRTRFQEILADDGIEANDSRIRRYKWIKIEDWGGELIFSAVIRCALRGSTLYVEGKRFILTPLAASNRRIDALQPDGFWPRLKLAVSSVFAGPIFCLVAPFGLLGTAFDEFKQWRQLRRFRRTMRTDPLYDYGAAQTLRQALEQPNYLHYFQKTDSDFYSKVIERKLFDELVQFLDDHEIDTSDIKERQTMILNSGVWVQGGNIHAEALAVGSGASASKQSGARVKETANA
jgi:hypothetical protein